MTKPTNRFNIDEAFEQYKQKDLARMQQQWIDSGSFIAKPLDDYIAEDSKYIYILETIRGQ